MYTWVGGGSPPPSVQLHPSYMLYVPLTATTLYTDLFTLIQNRNHSSYIRTNHADGYAVRFNALKRRNDNHLLIRPDSVESSQTLFYFNTKYTGRGVIQLSREGKSCAVRHTTQNIQHTCAALSPSRKATRMTASDAMNTLSTSLLNQVGWAPPRSVTTVTNGSSRLAIKHPNQQQDND